MPRLYTRRTYFRMALPGAALAVGLPLLLHHHSPYLGTFDLYALPVMVAVFLALFVLSWTRLGLERLEGTAQAFMNVFVVLRVLSVLADPQAPRPDAALGGCAPWVLIVMMTNAGFLPLRRSVPLNGLVVAVLALGALVWWPGGRPGPERPYLLNNTVQLLLAATSLLLAHMVVAQRSAAYGRRARQALREASVDALTGLPNRRALDAHLARRAAERASVMAVVLVDVDHFKAVNDVHGHGAGDDVLRGVAEALRDLLGPGHLVGRYGGEEFLCLLTVGSEAEAWALAERLRLGIAGRTFRGLGVTVSVGLALRPLPAAPAALLEAADQALYAAKAAGRNRVESRPQDGAPLRVQSAGAA